VGGVYDYGPLGVELKNNIKQAWWQTMVYEQENVVGLDTAILMNPRVWEASGHVQGFTDPMVDCKQCKKRFKQDEINDKKPCPECGGELTEARQFNLLMKTFLGVVEDAKKPTYLRGETCQGIYVNFENVLKSCRQKIPFGIAQIGKSFRNEITPGNFTFRTREFEQMELQFFVHPQESEKWFDFWQEQRLKWYLDLGIRKENIRFRKHQRDELAHYAKKAIDIEYKFPFGWKELEGIHNRSDWDLSRHSKFSGQELKYHDEATKTVFTPWVIETSGGIDRAALAFLVDAYEEISGGRTITTKSIKEEEIVLRFDKELSPVKVAILPLSKKEPLIKLAQQIYKNCQKLFSCQYDEVSSIGRRYRRQDEIGTPFCVTIDFESEKDKKVTVRDRDSMEQERVTINKLLEYLREKLICYR
jgi:glycyl-tRNA synthetase